MSASEEGYLIYSKHQLRISESNKHGLLEQIAMSSKFVYVYGVMAQSERFPATS